MTHDEMIAVIQAHKEGKAIQTRMAGGKWQDINCPCWDFSQYGYRAKPEPFKKCNEYTPILFDDGGLYLDIEAIEVPRDGRYKITIEEI